MASSPLQASPTARCLSDDGSEPVPANIRQPGERVARLPVVAEVHDERSALDGRRVDEAPIARVRGIIAVVAQDEILPGGNSDRPPVVAGRMIAAGGSGTAHEV